MKRGLAISEFTPKVKQLFKFFYFFHTLQNLHPDNIPEDREKLAAQLKEKQGCKSSFTIGKLLKDKDMWLISVGFVCRGWSLWVSFLSSSVVKITDKTGCAAKQQRSPLNFWW